MRGRIHIFVGFRLPETIAGHAGHRQRRDPAELRRPLPPGEQLLRGYRLVGVQPGERLAFLLRRVVHYFWQASIISDTQ